MKIKIIIAVLLTSILASCSEDFLDLPSEESLTAATYFQTEADFQGAVNGIYYDLQMWFRGSTAGPTYNAPSNLHIIGDTHSDIARYALNPNLRAFTGTENIADFVEDITVFSSYWNDFYTWISDCNQVLGRIDDVEFDDSSKANLKGQALFYRAYSYWWLVRLYGDAILHLDPVSTLDETSKTLSSEAEVKAQIIADATAAAGLLAGKAEQEAGRITKGAAFMLLADLHIWYGEWAEAESALNNITGYSLLGNYDAIFDPANKNNTESIFEIQYSEQGAEYASSFMYGMFPYPSSLEQIAEWTGISNPSAMTDGEQRVIPTPELMASYEDGDERFDASIMLVEDANGVALPMVSKYLHPHSLLWFTDENVPIYRYAEALLFMAEAANEQGKTGDAITYLNQVRSRAGLENTTASSQEEVRNAIMEERKVELAFEGKRWFDLVRTGKVQAVISAYGARVKADPAAYYFPSGWNPVPTSFTDFRTKFELPDSEKLYNPNID